MTADPRRNVLDDAWGHIPQAQGTTVGVGSFTRTRVERIISVAAGLGSLVLGAQAFAIALGSRGDDAAWHLPMLLTVFVPLAVMIIACLASRGVRPAAGVFAIAYVVVLGIWPIAMPDTSLPPTEEPWIWYLVNIATLAAVLAFPLTLQIVWTALAPLMFGLVRLIPGGFGPEGLWIAVALDVSFALILGGVLLTLGWVFRSVATNVDLTRAHAVESYAVAAAADAAEQERLAVAALMHDSVLAALIAAERAESPRERTLAVAMAREALTRLANAEQDAGEGSDEPTDASAIADEIELAAEDLGVDLVASREIATPAALIPGRVARALALAATQAVANSAQHAGAVGLAVTVTGSRAPARVRIEVRDAGAGFTLADVPADRLGIRGSIVARVAAVGGTTRIDAGALGTTVLLEWQEDGA